MGRGGQERTVDTVKGYAYKIRVPFGLKKKKRDKSNVRGVRAEIDQYSMIEDVLCK